jgi:hypothetical protein
MKERLGASLVSHGLWSEEQNILRQHMHKKEFWILTFSQADRGSKLWKTYHIVGQFHFAFILCHEG